LITIDVYGNTNITNLRLREKTLPDLSPHISDDRMMEFSVFDNLFYGIMHLISFWSNDMNTMS